MQINADKNFEFNRLSSAFIGGPNFFTVSELPLGAGADLIAVFRPG
jgi:hypothetical protein